MAIFAERVIIIKYVYKYIIIFPKPGRLGRGKIDMYKILPLFKNLFKS